MNTKDTLKQQVAELKMPAWQYLARMNHLIQTVNQKNMDIYLEKAEAWKEANPALFQLKSKHPAWINCQHPVDDREDWAVYSLPYAERINDIGKHKRMGFPKRFIELDRQVWKIITKAQKEHRYFLQNIDRFAINPIRTCGKILTLDVARNVLQSDADDVFIYWLQARFQEDPILNSTEAIVAVEHVMGGIEDIINFCKHRRDGRKLERIAKKDLHHYTLIRSCLTLTGVSARFSTVAPYGYQESKDVKGNGYRFLTKQDLKHAVDKLQFPALVERGLAKPLSELW